MPGLFSLGLHPALEAVQAELRPNESLFAYLDDLYVLCTPERARIIFDLVRERLWEHSRIHVHLGKTKTYNAGAVEPPRMRELGSLRDPCWVGDAALPPQERGMIILGAPMGHPEYVRHQLRATRMSHDLLLGRLPAIPDLQAAWLILLFCASPRCNHFLRMLTPD